VEITLFFSYFVISSLRRMSVLRSPPLLMRHCKTVPTKWCLVTVLPYSLTRGRKRTKEQKRSPYSRIGGKPSSSNFTEYSFIFISRFFFADNPIVFGNEKVLKAICFVSVPTTAEKEEKNEMIARIMYFQPQLYAFVAFLLIRNGCPGFN